LIIEHVGPDCFIWATDYPHPDHPDNWREGLERFVQPLSEETAAKVAGRNVKAIYGIG
jgi:predicted TIM-barrel fold metal-dependent hydrolase